MAFFYLTGMFHIQLKQNPLQTLVKFRVKKLIAIIELLQSEPNRQMNTAVTVSTPDMFFFKIMFILLLFIYVLFHFIIFFLIC